jgi:hypothetical protein
MSALRWMQIVYFANSFLDHGIHEHCRLWKKARYKQWQELIRDEGVAG